MGSSVAVGGHHAILTEVPYTSVVDMLYNRYKYEHISNPSNTSVVQMSCGLQVDDEMTS